MSCEAPLSLAPVVPLGRHPDEWVSGTFQSGCSCSWHQSSLCRFPSGIPPGHMGLHRQLARLILLQPTLYSAVQGSKKCSRRTAFQSLHSHRYLHPCMCIPAAPTWSPVFWQIQDSHSVHGKAMRIWPAPIFPAAAFQSPGHLRVQRAPQYRHTLHSASSDCAPACQRTGRKVSRQNTAWKHSWHSVPWCAACDNSVSHRTAYPGRTSGLCGKKPEWCFRIPVPCPCTAYWPTLNQSPSASGQPQSADPAAFPVPVQCVCIAPCEQAAALRLSWNDHAFWVRNPGHTGHCSHKESQADQFPWRSHCSCLSRARCHRHPRCLCYQYWDQPDRWFWAPASYVSSGDSIQLPQECCWLQKWHGICRCGSRLTSYHEYPQRPWFGVHPSDTGHSVDNPQCLWSTFRLLPARHTFWLLQHPYRYRTLLLCPDHSVHPEQLLPSLFLALLPDERPYP